MLEEHSNSFPRYDRLTNRKDIRDLVLCADETVVRSPVRALGADVRSHASEPASKALASAARWSTRRRARGLASACSVIDVGVRQTRV